MPDRSRLLVIDDDPLFRSLIVSLLRKDYFVSVASDGSEGFYKGLEHPPDVAVIDIKMPGWDGLKTLKAFRSHPALNRVKVVILTSDASKETVLAAIQGGANDYVIKTAFSKEEFLSKLDKLLPQKRARTARSTGRRGRGQRSAATRTGAKPKSAAAKLKDAHAAEDADPAASASSTAENDDPAALQEMIDSWE